MAGGISFRVNDREFTETLRKYVLVSLKEIPDIVNTKAFFIARRAVVETPKADLAAINALKGSALIGKMINKRRGIRGEKGLYGKEMSKAVGMVLAARRRSIAFLKSGWLPAIRILAGVVKQKRGVARADRSSKIYGVPKGTATAAVNGFRVRAVIENAANATRDNKDALIKYGEPALQKAFAFETQSMIDYMERKLKTAANSVGIRTS